MVEHRPILKIVTHLILIFGIVLVALPIWITFVASTHDEARMLQAPLPLLPGTHFFLRTSPKPFSAPVCLEPKQRPFGGC